MISDLHQCITNNSRAAPAGGEGGGEGLQPAATRLGGGLCEALWDTGGGGGGGGGELTQAGGEGPLRGTEEGRRAGDVQNHIIQSEL